ncbi:flagellar hook-length control protein FliK [Clostridium sp.]|uniref:flagellar hook-length control protein FliK n=1 Tax=Clostridium sp. TaxID=1506 RepID=UPI002605929E|nr:flagellar hook-length control protein FliK [Clostridium sp.]
MPGIWNISNGYNVNSKKISSKLSFEVGERFTGKVVAKGEGKDISIRLADGWQFIAELEDNVDLDDLKLVKFQVDGLENGKLKLKLVQGAAGEETTEDDNFQEIIQKEGLSKDDIDILKNMVKHNIPLTRDNINEIKGLIQFNEKISANPKEIDTFIQTYLQSKNIPVDSAEGQSIKETLTKFFNEFKNMTSDDILAFIENNLDFSEETIISFNKLFKGDSSIEQILTKMNDSLNSLEIADNASGSDIEIFNSKISSKEPEFSKSNLDFANALASKVYNENDPLTKKINILDVLKTLAGSEDSELDMVQKNANNPSNAIKENIDPENEKVDLPASLVEKLDNQQLVKIIKDTIGGNLTNNDFPKNQAERLIESTNKTKLEGLLSNIDGKEVKLTDDEFRSFTKLLNNKSAGNEVANADVSFDKGNVQPKEAATNNNVIKETVTIKETVGKLNANDLLARNDLDNKDAIKNEIKDKIDNVRDIVKNLVAQTELKDAGYEKIMNLVKSNINDIKVFNSVSNEYYYLNMPINANNHEYPCKLIIKDNRKDGKKIDTTNTKMVVSVKTINLGEVDGYLTMRDNRMDVNLKCNSEFTTTLNNNKSKLADGLSTLGLFVKISVSAKDKPADIVSCRNFFNDLTISAIDIKV